MIGFVIIYPIELSRISQFCTCISTHHGGLQESVLSPILFFIHDITHILANFKIFFLLMTSFNHR